MNKIFKVVWSKTKECYVVVSEVAKNNGGKKKVLASVLAGLAMVGTGAQVQAYNALGGTDNPSVDTLAVGPYTWADKEGAVAVGIRNNANGQPVGKHSVAIGNFSNANGEISIAMGGIANASGKMSVAVGYQASATDEAAVALGNMVSADKNSTGVGPGATASGTYAFAGGYQSETTGISGVAIGDNAKAKAARAMAIGGHAEATAEQAIAIGSDTGAGTATTNKKTTASGKNAIAVGNGSKATTNDSLAMGSSAEASGLNAAAVGKNSKASGQSSVALGDGTQSTNLNTTAIGSNVQSTKTGSIGIGGNVESIGDYSVAIGSASKGKTVKAVDYATAVGGLSNAAERAAAFGAGANAAQARSVAVGLKATANTADGVAIGSTSVASTAAGVQGFDSAENRTRKYTNLTGNVQTSTLAAVSVGDGSTVTRQITGLAAGKEDTDAVNVAQLKNVGVRVGADTNTATIGTNKVAADFLAYNGQLNIKGDNNRVTTESSNDANGKDANVNVKFDYDGLVKAKNGSAVTVDQKTDAAGKTYFEIDAAAGSKTVVADGKNTTVTGAGTTASPYKVNVEGALTGISSITNNGGGKIEFTTGGTTISGGPVNVSNNKITGVANGDVNSTSTDAVNGSQLHAVKTAERHIAPTTAGSEYTVDSNGDVTMTYLDGNNNAVANEKAVIKGIAKNDLSNITNEGKKEITKLGTIVKAGDNVNVTSTSDGTTGRTTYTVNAVTPAVYTKADGTKVVKRPDGTFTTNLDGSAGNNVDKGDVITSFMDGNGNTTGGNMVINNVGSAIDKTGTSTGNTFLTKLDTAATNTPNAAVNVRDLKTTSDALVDKGLKFTGNNTGTENAHKLGSLVKVQGEGVAATAVPSFASAAGNIAVVADGTDTLEIKLNKNLKGINSVSNGSSSITLNSTPGGTGNTPAVSITGGNVDVGGNNITNLKSGGNTDSNAANIGDVKKIASDTDTHIKPGTYTVAADKTVTMTYVNGKGETVQANGQDVVAKIDLSGLPTGGTSSTEKVQKAADATGDKNIADVNPKAGDTFGAADATYEVSVSRNAVKDAAREAVTVNNGGTTKADGSYTADSNNPISVTPTKDDNKHNTSYAVTFDGDKAAKQIPLTYKATNGTTTSAAQTVTLDKGLNFTGGDYTTASVGADGKVTFDVNLGTTPTVTDGKPGVPGQAGATGKDGIATVKTVVDTINNSGWKANAIANGGKLDGAATATVVKPGNTVNYAAGKNLIVNQELEKDASNALTGNQTYTYSLNKDIDLTKDGSLTVGDTTVNNGGITIKAPTPAAGTTATTDVKLTNTGLDNGGNKIVNVKDGDVSATSTDAVNGSQLHAVKAAERHIKPDTYTVDGNGKVTMKYVDGDNQDVTGEAIITGIAKQDLSNINDAGKKVITGLGSIVEAGDNVTVTSTENTTTGQKTYTVNAVTPVVYTTPSGEKLTKKSDGKFYKADGSEYTGGDIIASFENPNANSIPAGKNSTTDGGMIVNNIGSAIKGLGSTGDNYLTKLNLANTATPNAAVNVSDLKNTADALKSNELHIRPTVTNRTDETVNKNTAGTAESYKYDSTTKSVTLKYNDGTGASVTGTEAKIDLSDLANQITSGYTFKTNATENGGKVVNDAATPAAETTVANGGVVNYAAGKNLTVKQDIEKDATGAATGKQTYTYALADEIGIGEKGQPGVAGKDGVDGKIGVNGKDGSSVVINGKDGSIGMTGPKGQDGKDGINGRNGADISITSAKGEQVLINRDPAHNADTDKAERIVYVPKDASGNPIQDANGKNIVREVATMDDGLKFGGDMGAVNSVKLNKQVDVKGGITDATKLATGNNIGVTSGIDPTTNNATLNVQLAKDITGLNSVQIGGNTIKTDGDHITITTPGATPGSTVTNKVANLGDEKHITQGNYTVGDKTIDTNAANDEVILTYTDGNGNLVKDAANKPIMTKIKGIANSDLSNISDAGKKVITGLGTIVKAGDNVSVSESSDATTGQKTYTVNAVTPAVYTTPDGTKLTKDKDGKFHKEGETAEYTGDIITSFENPKAATGQTTKDGGMIVNNIGSAIKTQNPTMPAGQTATYLDKLKAAADAGSNVKNAAVNVSDLHNTAEALKASELHIAPTEGGTDTDKGGVASGNTNPGAAAKAYKYNATTKQVELTFNDGNGKKVTGPKAVIDFSDLVIPAGGNNYGFNTNAGGNIKDNATVTATAVGSGKTVTYAAGKNLTVEQKIGTDGNQTYTYALNKDLTNLDKVVVNGKDGQPGKDGVTIIGPQGATGTPGTNGIDGKVGISGKDGKDAVSISGKDGVGHIGLTGPQGPQGPGGTPGTPGANIDISTDHGTQTLVKPEANNNDKSERIVYVPKDSQGNPLKDTAGKDIVREVATMDDGLKFTGNNTVIENKQQLGSLVKVQGEGTKEGTTVINPTTGEKELVLSDGTTKFESAKDNIAVVADGDNKLTVKLNKDLQGINSVSNGASSITLNDAPNATTPAVTIKGGNLSMGDGTTNGNNKIVNLAPGTADTDAVNYGQIKGLRTEVKPGSNVTVNKTQGSDGHDIYTISATVTGGAASTWNIKSSADTTNGGATATGHDANPVNISDQKTIEMVAGKNLTVKQGATTDGAKVEFALSDEIGLGEKAQPGVPGKDGVDGKIGVNGKDGSAVVINGKDGSIGLNGKDGANGITIKGDKGVDGVDGLNGTNGITRIVYQDKDGNKHEVATHDDGMKFAGDDGQTNQDTNPQVIKKHLNKVVDIVGGADKTKLTIISA